MWDIARAQIEQVPPYDVMLFDRERELPERMAAAVVDDVQVDRLLSEGRFGEAALCVMYAAAVLRIEEGLRNEDDWANRYRGYDFYGDILEHMGED